MQRLNQQTPQYTREDILAWSLKYYVHVPIEMREILAAMRTQQDEINTAQQQKNKLAKNKQKIIAELALIETLRSNREIRVTVDECQNEVNKLHVELSELSSSLQQCEQQLLYLDKRKHYIAASEKVTQLAHNITAGKKRLTELDDELERLSVFVKTYQAQAMKINYSIEAANLEILACEEADNEGGHAKISMLRASLVTLQEGLAVIRERSAPVEESMAGVRNAILETENNIAQWTAEAEKLSDHTLAELSEIKAKLSQSGITELNEAELLKRKLSLEDKLRDKTVIYQERKMTLAENEAKLSELQKIDDKKYISMNNPELRVVLSTLQQLSSLNDDDTHKLDLKIEALQAQLQALERKLKDNVSDKSELEKNQFMLDLFDNPKKMIDSCKALFESALRDYEWRHPMAQFPAVKACIHEYVRIAHEVHVDGDMAKEIDLCLNKYYLLLGWLYEIYERTYQYDSFFADKVVKVIAVNPLCKVESMAELKKLRAQQPDDFCSISAEMLHRLEKAEYEMALTALQQAIKSKSKQKDFIETMPLYRAAENLGYEISTYVKSHQEHFDYKYFTTLLSACAQVLDNPLDVNAIKRYKHYADFNVIGNASEKYQMRGALLLFVSAAIALISIVCGMVTFGLLAPLTVAGLGVSATILLIGLGAMVYGRQKGIDRSLTLFHEKAHAKFEQKQIELAPSLSTIIS